MATEKPSACPYKATCECSKATPISRKTVLDSSGETARMIDSMVQAGDRPQRYITAASGDRRGSANRAMDGTCYATAPSDQARMQMIVTRLLPIRATLRGQRVRTIARA